MTKEEILSKFNEIVNKDKIKSANLNRWIKTHYLAFYKEIEQLTYQLNKFKTFKPGTQKLLDVSIYERIYCIKHNLSDRPKCKVCGKNYVRFINKKQEYAKWCSISCSCRDKETIEKARKTKLKLYGNETYVNLEKARQTRSLKNNGKWHNCDFSKKIKQTCLERYGVENYVNPDKAKQTKLEKYGSETYNNYEKCCITKENKYGNPNYNNRKKFKDTISQFDKQKKQNIKNKRISTNIDKYGTLWPTQSNNIKENTKQTCLKKYGVDCYLKTDTVRQIQKQKLKEQTWQRIISDKNYSPMFSYQDFLNNKTECIWKWKCNKCGNVFEALYDNGQHHRCYKCYPNTTCGTSLAEQKITEYIQSLTSYKVYNRSPENKRIIDKREIDIYIPELKLGIEYDGLFYHSEDNGKGKNYHLQKTELCKEKGIQLIHIFEDEWIEKQDIVKARLKHLILNSNKHRIFARKCEVREIDNVTKDNFLRKYHIQGKDISKIRLGLFFNNYLVAVMTFIKSRFSEKYEYELSRYATVSNFTIIGGAGKLLTYFERTYKPKSIITYADRRWSQGKLYYKLGFQYSHSSAPNYFYVKNQHRFSRLLFQKHKLNKLLQIFDPNLSEAQNMKNNGYDRIFDCGNLVFVKNYE